MCLKQAAIPIGYEKFRASRDTHYEPSFLIENQLYFVSDVGVVIAVYFSKQVIVGFVSASLDEPLESYVLAFF
jgi:hypothetical protein